MDILETDDVDREPFGFFATYEDANAYAHKLLSDAGVVEFAYDNEDGDAIVFNKECGPVWHDPDIEHSSRCAVARIEKWTVTFDSETVRDGDK